MSNVLGAMKGIATDRKQQIIMHQMYHFFRADMEPGMRIAQGLALDMAEVMSNMPQPKQEAAEPARPGKLIVR